MYILESVLGCRRQAQRVSRVSAEFRNMSKRPRNPTDTDTDVSECSEASDGSYCEAPKPRSKRTRQTRKVASKRARASAKTNVVESAAQSQGVGQSSSAQVTHPTSWHVVTGVDPIRESLLDWYGRTHKDRGMPWRKPFDGSLDKDSRGQRAYEVRCNSSFPADRLLTFL